MIRLLAAFTDVHILKVLEYLIKVTLKNPIQIPLEQDYSKLLLGEDEMPKVSKDEPTEVEDKDEVE